MGTAGTFTVSTGEEVVLYINATDDFYSNVNYSVTAGQLDLVMNNTVGYIYTGTTTFLTSLYSSIRMKDCFIAMAVPGTQLLNITGASQSQQFWSPIRCTFVYCDPGSISYIGIIARGVLFVDWTDTLEITDVAYVYMNEVASNQPGLTPNGKPMISINTESGDPDSDINIVTAGGYTLPTDSLIRIEPDISNNARILLSNITMAGTLFDETGSTGSFTTVADASISAQSIASVTDSSGIARFNWTPGATVYVGQEVQVSGYVTNTAYNGTWIVTTTGVGYFEVSSIAFGSDEATGTFDSDSVTITSASHGLANLTGVTLDTALATDYDGGVAVYNSQTNTFQVNRAWTATQTGTWSTKGLSQIDPRVISIGSPSYPDSRYHFSGYVNNNTTAVGTIVNNTFRSMEFGTLIETSSTERFKLIDTQTGIFEYTGNEEITVDLANDYTTVSSGGAVEFRFLWYVDKNTGTFVAIDDPNEAMNELGSVAAATSGHSSVVIQKGYKLQPRVTRSTGTSALTVRYATITGSG
jgi:hypothetical protein